MAMINVPKASPAASAEVETIDAPQFEKAKDLIHYLANTISAMKIFPGEHATVRSFVDELSRKFADYMAAYAEIQIGVEEYSFTMGGKPIYSDELAIKSLPFFFFKDGLQVLYFYSGLDRQEILDFLELIKTEAHKASEDADIVAALWERDFPNIQYYAPEEFLEDRIMAESRDSRDLQGPSDRENDLARETIEVRVDTSKLSQGRIDLDQEDRNEVEKGTARPDEEMQASIAAAADEAELAEGGAPREASQKSPAAAMDPTFTEAEIRSLEAMVRVNRTISAEEEYIDLMVEIIFLEEDLSNCRASLDALLEYHFDQLQRGHFHVAVTIIQKVHELGRHMAGNPAKALLLDEFLKRTISPQTLESVKTLLAGKKPMDWESLLGFFGLLGPPALPLAADLFEIAPDHEARQKIIAFIEKTGRHNPGVLTSLADNSRPGLAREIIGVLSRLPDHRGVPHLSAFLNFQNKAIKFEVLNVLGQSGDDMANSIIAGFLNDPDEEVRIQAAMTIDPREGGRRIQQIIRESMGRQFQAKSLKEKKAIMILLGRTRSAQALEFLRDALLQTSLLPSKRTLELRLAAVAGLESMGTEEALEALRKGALGRTKRVREACQEASARLLSIDRAGN